MTVKESRNPESFKLFVAATKVALEEAKNFGSIAEFMVHSMAYQQDHPELDMLTVFGITLEASKRDAERGAMV